MPGYRFCRPDDIPLLVRAVNECLIEPEKDELWTVARFKREMREIGLWPSSCMLAFSGDGETPVGMLLGCKRANGTRVYKVGVHPEHRRQGHARHMLTSLSGKLAVLGPPVLLTEIAEHQTAFRELVAGLGYRISAELADYVLVKDTASRVPECVGPVTVSEAEHAGLLSNREGLAWEQAVDTLGNRETYGLGFSSVDSLEACLFYCREEGSEGSAIVRFCAREHESAPVIFSVLLSALRAESRGKITIHKFGEPALSKSKLESMGFEIAARYFVYQTRASAH